MTQILLGPFWYSAKMLTSGVKRNLIPSVEPLRVSPLMRKMVRTRYGRVEVTYTAWEKKDRHVNHTNEYFLTTQNPSDVMGLSYLATCLNAPDAADVKQRPGSYERHNHPPLQTSRVIDSFWGVQSFSVPEVVDSGATCALFHQSLREQMKTRIRLGLNVK